MTAHPATYPDGDSTELSASLPVVEPGDSAKGFAIRDATPADNEQLIALAAACSMMGDISLRIDRGPDFFALNRLEGQSWRVGVAERAGMIVGCVAISERLAYVNARASAHWLCRRSQGSSRASRHAHRRRAVALRRARLCAAAARRAGDDHGAGGQQGHGAKAPRTARCSGAHANRNDSYALDSDSLATARERSRLRSCRVCRLGRYR